MKLLEGKRWTNFRTQLHVFLGTSFSRLHRIRPQLNGMIPGTPKQHEETSAWRNFGMKKVGLTPWNKITTDNDDFKLSSQSHARNFFSARSCAKGATSRPDTAAIFKRGLSTTKATEAGYKSLPVGIYWGYYGLLRNMVPIYKILWLLRNSLIYRKICLADAPPYWAFQLWIAIHEGLTTGRNGWLALCCFTWAP